IIDKTKIDGVKEVEIIVDDFEEACNLLVNIGLTPGPYQENFRETWKFGDCLATIDEWPGLDPFIEIEGPSEQSVQKVTSELGFKFEDSEFGSIDLIYQKTLGINPGSFNSIPRLDFGNYKSVLGL